MGEQLPLVAEFLMQLVAELEDPLPIGETPLGQRIVMRVKGGIFSGPGLNGRVLPGGGDWLLFRRDGAGQLDVRITLQTDDGVPIFVSYHGISDMAPGLRQRILKGETVDPGQYYFRITPVFETAAEKYGWLNKLVSVGIGQRTASSVIYSIYAIN